MAIDPVDDLTFVYTDEYYSTSSSFGWTTEIGSFQLAPPILPAAKTGLTSFSDNAGAHAFYVGTNQNVYQLIWTSATGWVDQNLTNVSGGTLAAPASKLAGFADGAGEHAFYFGPNQHVYQLIWTSATGWNNQDLTAITGNTLAASGSAVAGFSDGAGEHAFYLGTNRHVYQLIWTSATGWNNQDLTAITGNTLAASGSAVAGFSDGAGAHAFYFGPNQHVYQLIWTSATGWNNQDLTTQTGGKLAESGTGLTAFSDSSGEHAFYLGTNQHVYQLIWTSATGWNNQDLTAITGNTLAEAGSALTGFADSVGEHTFYLGTNQHVYQLIWTGATGWSNQDLTTISE
jgi:hypothetical protein